MRKLMIMVAIISMLTAFSTVSAMTTGQWDLSAAQASINAAVENIYARNQQENWFVWDSEVLNQIFADWKR